MWISKLSLTNFRNLRSVELELPSTPIVVCGSNAEGKTNFLEALYMLAIAKSYRATTEREMVSWSRPDFESPLVITASIQKEDNSTQIQIIIQPSELSTISKNDNGAMPLNTRKHIRINGVPRQASQLVGHITAVLFTALDMELVTGSPSARRRYLDILLCLLEMEYLKALRRYQHIITQRNYLLRQARDVNPQVALELRFWNEELARNGAVVVEHRIRAMNFLSTRASSIYRNLSNNGEELSLEYICNPDMNGVTSRAVIEEKLLTTLEEQQAREINAGLSLVGPHRDDIQFRIDGILSGIYGSRGQSRSIALALRLAEAEFLREEKEEEPVLLLDDVLSELDINRRRYVLDVSASYKQVIMTTTDWDRIDTDFRKSATCFTLQRGNFRIL
jgi:DNA replication and repair protein RecF